MVYRKLGKTGLEASEIGLGAEWLERHGYEEIKAVIDTCAEAGINILDCWMSEPNVRTNIGKALKGTRKRWIIQGHIGSTWQNGQYVRTRDMKYVVPAFEDLLKRLQTDYVDLGMIHYVDAKQKRSDRKIDDYYENIRRGKQEKLFYEVIFQIGNKDDMNVQSKEGQLAKDILCEFMEQFQKRNPNLHIFSSHLHMDEQTPHIHIDFVPFIRNSKRGLDTRVSLKGALAEQGSKAAQGE